jgi:regulatory protein
MDLEKFYNKALRFLSFRPRSEKEVRENLKKKKASESIVELVIRKLKEQKFLDDKEFTNWWIEQRTLIKLKPKRVIKMELKQKGIDDELIDELLEKVSLHVPDLEKAKRIVEKKIQKYKSSEPFKTKEKLGRYLASKGFDYDTIKEALKDL